MKYRRQIALAACQMEAVSGEEQLDPEGKIKARTALEGELGVIMKNLRPTGLFHAGSEE